MQLSEMQNIKLQLKFQLEISYLINLFTHYQSHLRQYDTAHLELKISDHINCIIRK